MLEWSEYLKTVVSSKTVIDNFTLSCDEGSMRISPIVKASILMLEDMISSQGNHNIFVFPEIQHLSKEFLLSKVIYNITAGKIQMSYDPQKFQKGQILKYKGCSVEFDKIEEGKDGQTRIYVKFSDGMLYGVPVEFAPYFQIGESKKLSTYKRFKEKYSAQDAKMALENPVQSKNYLEVLENHKTHLDGSIFYVSSIKSTREFLTSAELDGRRITDVLYMAQTNGDGELSNISAGQLVGNPAIIIASDLYAVQNAIIKGVVPQSVIFDASQQNAVDKQLDAFDELGRQGFPIVCITDTAESFELNSLIERGYNLWRWDHDSITDDVISFESTYSNNRVKNCARHKIDYQSAEDTLISPAVKLLYGQKSEIEEQHPRIISAYEKLFSIAFTMLRTVVPLDASDKTAYKQVIDNCLIDIEAEKRFITPGLYNDLTSAAKLLLQLFETAVKNSKYEVICDVVLGDQYRSVCIVIPEKLDRIKYEKYWETLDFPCRISVMYPLEYQEKPESNFDLVIIVGWLGNKVMRKVIYGYSATKYLVLTYPCEEKWKHAHTRIWKKALSNSGNSEVVKKSFSKSDRQISSVRFEHNEIEDITQPAVDELDDIELVLRTNRYKQYSNGAKPSEIVEAYPVSFVGGYLAFYRSGHKALVATDIIVNAGDKIENKLPEKLEVGDFVVIREAEHDIIRDLADKILERSEKSELRALSAKWKEALSVETLFSTNEAIYQKLCENGCKKDFVTVRNWMTNDELIQPNDKEDLLCIATATGDDVLKEKLDIIYEAGREVRSAHVQAGRILSQRLKSKIAEHIHGLGEIDTFNVWDPISLQLEDIGQVRILKVIDVNSAIPVDVGNTNRLLSE